MFLKNSYLFWIFILFMFVQFTASLLIFGVTPILPFIQGDFQLSIVQIGYLAAALQLGAAFTSIPSGLMVDIFGIKRAVILGCILLGLASILLSFLNLYAFILIDFFFIGVFYSVINPAMSKAIVEIFPAKIRGTLTGIKQVCVSFSTFLAALILPSIATHAGWRLGYLITGILVILSGMTILLYKKSKANRVEASRQTFSLRHFAYLLRNDSLRIACWTVPFLFMAQFVTATYLMVDLNGRFSMPLIQAGLLLATMQLGSIIGRIIFGLIGDWVFMNKRELLLSLITGFAGVFLLLFAWIPFTSFIILSILVFCIGFTGAGWNAIFLVFVSETVAVQFVGVASGLVMTLGFLGSTAGTPFFGYFSEVTGGFTNSWVILAGSMLIACVLFLRLYKKNNNIRSTMQQTIN